MARRLFRVTSSNRMGGRMYRFGMWPTIGQAAERVQHINRFHAPGWHVVEAEEWRGRLCGDFFEEHVLDWRERRAAA